MREKIEFNFKGGRSYVHGSDVYNKCNKLLNASEWITDISFRNFSSRCGILTDTYDNSSDRLISSIKTNDRSLFLIEDQDPVLSTVEFDEQELIKPAKLNDNKISMNYDARFSIIENIIALTKMLNYSIDPVVDGKWVFAQFKAGVAFTECVNSIEIISSKRIACRFSENILVVDKAEIGKVNFIVGKP